MTSVRETSPATEQAPLVPKSSRVPILVGGGADGEGHQIAIVMPSDVQLDKLTEYARLEVNKALRAAGEPGELPPGRYEFARAVAAGNSLMSPDMTLSAHSYRDGTLVALLPAGRAQRYGTYIENVSTVLARWAQQHFAAVSTEDAKVVAAALSGAALFVAALLLWRIRWATTALFPATAYGVAAVTLIIVAALTARMGGQRAIADGATWTAIGFAALTGVTAPPGAHPGCAHAFLLATVSIIGPLTLVRLTQRHYIPAAATVTVGAAALTAATARMFWAVPGQRIALVMLVAVYVASRLAPMVGLWMAKVPRQTFTSITGRDLFARAPGQPEDTVSPVESAPHDVTLRGDQVGEVALRSNRVLAGALLGVALVQVVASWFAINPSHGHQTSAVVITAVIALALILRARAFRDRRHAITGVVGAAVSLLSIPTHYALAAPPNATITGLIAAGVALGVAAAAVLSATIVPAHIFSPITRQLVEWTEYLLVFVVIPFTAFAIGLMQYVRYH